MCIGCILQLLLYEHHSTQFHATSLSIFFCFPRLLSFSSSSGSEWSHSWSGGVTAGSCHSGGGCGCPGDFYHLQKVRNEEGMVLYSQCQPPCLCDVCACTYTYMYAYTVRTCIMTLYLYIHTYAYVYVHSVCTV